METKIMTVTELKEWQPTPTDYETFRNCDRLFKIEDINCMLENRYNGIELTDEQLALVLELYEDYEGNGSDWETACERAIERVID